MDIPILSNLLTEDELKEIKRLPFTALPAGLDIKDLTVKNLSDIGLILMRTELGSDDARIPEGTIIPAKAIEILLNRAEQKNIPVF